MSAHPGETRVASKDGSDYDLALYKKNNVSIPLEFRFKTKIGGFMWDHWELTVTKIKPGDFKTSSVTNGIWNNSTLDSEDVVLTPKGHGKKQRGTVHEFGHMLGLADEYKDSSAHKTDYASVMNRGEVIYPRHRKKFADWVSANV